MNVVRNVPMYLRPHMLFSPHTPICSTSVLSVSAISVKGSSFLAMNFWCEAALSTLTPTTS